MVPYIPLNHSPPPLQPKPLAYEPVPSEITDFIESSFFSDTGRHQDAILDYTSLPSLQLNPNQSEIRWMGCIRLVTQCTLNPPTLMEGPPPATGCCQPCCPHYLPLPALLGAAVSDTDIPPFLSIQASPSLPLPPPLSSTSLLRHYTQNSIHLFLMM